MRFGQCDVNMSGRIWFLRAHSVGNCNLFYFQQNKQRISKQNSKSTLDTMIDELPQNATKIRKQSTLRKSKTKRMTEQEKEGKKENPNEMHFGDLRKEYEKDTTIQVPFAKSNFVHYSKCPRSLIINGKAYDDLIITMELVEVPKDIKTYNLGQRGTKKKKEGIAGAVQQKMASKLLLENQQLEGGEAESDSQKTGRNEEEHSVLMIPEDRHNDQDMPNSHAEVASFMIDKNPGDRDSSIENQSLALSYESNDESQEQDEWEEETSSDESEHEELGGKYGGDRTYTGNMFARRPQRLELTRDKLEGQENAFSGTIEQCCISLWSSSDDLMRFKRLKNTIIPLPPIGSDTTFRVAHDAKRIYYLGVGKGERGGQTKKLITLNMRNLRYKTYELGSEAVSQIKTLEHSSLVEHYLCYMTETLENAQSVKTRKFQRNIRNFTVLDLQTQKSVWLLKDCVNVFFTGADKDTLSIKEFQDQTNEDDPETDTEEGFLQEGEYDKKVRRQTLDGAPLDNQAETKEIVAEETEVLIQRRCMVIKASWFKNTSAPIRDKTDVDGSNQQIIEQEAGDKGAEEPAVQLPWTKFYRTYDAQWAQNFDPELVQDGEEHDKAYDKDHVFENLKYETKIDLRTNNPNIAKRAQDSAKPEVITEHRVIATMDCRLEKMCLIIMSLSKNDQHKVFLFDDEEEATSMTSRVSHADLEFNMNAHVRNHKRIFLIQSEPGQGVTAKQLQFSDDKNDDHDVSQPPPITFTRPRTGSPKDCWVVDQETYKNKECGNLDQAETSDDEPRDLRKSIKKRAKKFCKVMTISMSEDGPFIGTNCIIPLNEPNLQAGEKIKLENRFLRIEAQQVHMSYPCVASNIGSGQIFIQSVVHPDELTCLKMDEIKVKRKGCDKDIPVEFVSFTDYKTLNDIGMQDSSQIDQDVPFVEKGDRIAFITRTICDHVCEFDDDKNTCNRGDMLLSVLTVDPYAKNTRFELVTTEYEACMDEGLADDYMQKLFTLQLNSDRGVDQTFCAQYRDRIIFDCITSTVQNPIRFPMPTRKQVNKWKMFDPDFQYVESFEQLQIAKTGKMVQQKMIQDESRAIIWMMKDDSDAVRVMRANPSIEMGSEDFVQCVFQLRSSKIYFLLHHLGLFYMMDDSKKIRVMQPDQQTQMWKQIATKELAQEDANQIDYIDFDDFAISPCNLQYKSQFFFLYSPQETKSQTFASEEYLLENNDLICGPYYGRATGMIWSIQNYFGKIDLETQLNKNVVDEKQQFKGHSLVVQPLIDSSYLDILPQHGGQGSNNSFISFLSDDMILVNYRGHFVILNHKGKFLYQVNFQMSSSFKGMRKEKLVFVSDCQRFFVFEGKNKLTEAERKDKRDKKNERKNNLGQNYQDRQQTLVEEKKEQKKGGAKARKYFPFKLVRAEDKASNATRTPGQEKETKYKYSFVPMVTELCPEMDEKIKARETTRIDYRGKMTVCTIGSKLEKEEHNEVMFNVEVEAYRCHEFGKKDQLVEAIKVKQKGRFGQEIEVEQQDVINSTERYKFGFNPKMRQNCEEELKHQIEQEKQHAQHGHASKEMSDRLARREDQFERAWVFDNFVVAKCGSSLASCKRDKQKGKNKVNERENSQIIPLLLDSSVWIENIYATGVQDYVQILLIKDISRQLFVITWDLNVNRELSLYQTDFEEGIFGENLVLRGNSLHKELDFNYILDKNTIVDLQDNLPVQFFDMIDDPLIQPRQVITGLVEGMKRVTSDRAKYLDIIKPGRVHLFKSLTDILYLQRLQEAPENHEITTHKTISTFGPFARFYNGSTVFHHFAADLRLLETVTDKYKQQLGKVKDSLMRSIPLLFIYSNPLKNTINQKTTPIHIAFDKRSPAAFATMFELLVDQNKICVTTQLFDVLEQIIDTGYPVVTKFFDESFYVTDQFKGLHALYWPQTLDEEVIKETRTAFLSYDYLQNCVTDDEKGKQAALNSKGQENIAIEQLKKNNEIRASKLERYDLNYKETAEKDGPHEYKKTLQVEETVELEANIKQVEAKLLDFSWIFVGSNYKKVIEILAKTKNDAIFATVQIRVLIDFLWNAFYQKIFWHMFLPFVVNFVTFLMFSSYYAQIYQENFTKFKKMQEWTVLGLYIVSLLGIIYQEFSVIKKIGAKAYLSDGWNWLDIVSIIMNFIYIISVFSSGDVKGHGDEEASFVNVLGSICIFLMYVKFFYWLRLFRPFSAFIRMISEILSDVKVFFIVLLMSLLAFANIIFILNINRGPDFGCEYEDDDGKLQECGKIYDSVFGTGSLDSIVHAYLLGLGEFQVDNYSHDNKGPIWFFFLAATLTVQLLFMNLLIAIMGSSYGRINEIIDQSTMKELCILMNDHIWILDIEDTYKDMRYILWLTPETTVTSKNAVERGIKQVQTEQKTLENMLFKTVDGIQNIAEDLFEMKAHAEQNQRSLETLSKEMDKMNYDQEIIQADMARLLRK